MADFRFEIVLLAEGIIRLMILKLALLLWFIALLLSFTVEGSKRSWIFRCFLGGFCLLVLGIFLKLIGRLL
jgi:hypothetical protein